MYFTVIFRRVFGNTETTITTANTSIYSITRSTTAPTGLTGTVTRSFSNGAIGSFPTKADGKPDGAPDPIAVPVLTTLRANNQFRAIRLVNFSGRPIEIYRMNFVVTERNPTTGAMTSTIVVPPLARVQLTDTTRTPLLADTVSPDATGACPTGYTAFVDPVSKFTMCRLDTARLPADQQGFYSYPLTTGKICRLGYKASGSNCVLIYDLQDFITSIYSSNPSIESPRLYLADRQAVVINFNDYIKIDGYFIVPGSATNLPTSWIVEGTNNGVQWAEISRITTTFSGQMAVPSGYYLWGNTATSPSVSQPSIWINQPVKEEFKNPSASRMATAALPVPAPSRLSWLRFRWAEPSAKAVTMSVLRFYTESGAIVPPSAMRITNLGGSRRSGAEGPDALLSESNQQRWVDYNKQPLIVRFVGMPPEPITAFRFAKPVTTGDAVVPSHWILEGSTDGRTWTTVQDYRAEAAPMLAMTSAYLRLLRPL